MVVGGIGGKGEGDSFVLEGDVGMWYAKYGDELDRGLL